MSKLPQDKIGRWMVALAVMAFVSLGYAFFTFARLDWVRYVTQPYYWRVQALSCPEKQPQPVVILSRGPDTAPSHTLNHDPELTRYLQSLPAAQPVKVEIKRMGYLWEWNYGEHFVVAIESQGIPDYLRKHPQDLEGCAYHPADSLDPGLLLVPYGQAMAPPSPRPSH